MIAMHKVVTRKIMSPKLMILRSIAGRCALPGWSQAGLLPCTGKNHARRLPLRHRALPGHLPVALRHSGEARSTYLGTDLLDVRYAACMPPNRNTPWCFPSITLARSREPSTTEACAYSQGTAVQLLQETTDEMARDGCKKLIIVNGHGGNEHLLPFSPRASWKSRMITWCTWWNRASRRRAPQGRGAPAPTGTPVRAKPPPCSSRIPNWCIRIAPK